MRDGNVDCFAVLCNIYKTVKVRSTTAALLLADDIEMIRNGYMQREKLRPRVNRAEMERLILYILSHCRCGRDN